MTTVVNVKVEYIRPKYNNLEEWMEDCYIYIGRKGIVFINNERYPKKDSVWANPFKISKKMTREMVLPAYKNYIINKLDNCIISRDELMNLNGKVLGCWCKHPICKISCHGDILIELLTKYQ